MDNHNQFLCFEEEAPNSEASLEEKENNKILNEYGGEPLRV